MDRTSGVDQRLHGYRFPAIVIGEVVWLRFRFNLSLRAPPVAGSPSADTSSVDTGTQTYRLAHTLAQRAE